MSSQTEPPLGGNLAAAFQQEAPGAGVPPGEMPSEPTLTGRRLEAQEGPAEAEDSAAGAIVTASSQPSPVLTPPPVPTGKAQPASAPPAAAQSRRGGAAPAMLTAFTVQCAMCFKWRKVPTLEEYEGIRARISQTPFLCEQARRWKPKISCSDPPDLQQDGKLLWAMDRPDIPVPPPGWRRRIVVRGGSSNKFSDVYYHAPDGKTLRSSKEVEKYLSEHPEYEKQGVTLKQFSFSSPRPLNPPGKASQGAVTDAPGTPDPAADATAAAKRPAEPPASEPAKRRAQ